MTLLLALGVLILLLLFGTAAGKALGQIHPLVLTNFALGWAAVLAVQVWR